MAKRGSGTLAERVTRLSSKLSPEQNGSAEKLASQWPVDVLKLAYYKSAVQNDTSSASATEPETSEVEV